MQEVACVVHRAARCVVSTQLYELTTYPGCHRPSALTTGRRCKRTTATSEMLLLICFNATHRDDEQDPLQQREQRRDWLDDRVRQHDGQRQGPGENRDHIDVAE